MSHSLLWVQRNVREHGASTRAGGDAADSRTPAQKDRDRVLYTSAFRRLAGVTQVVAPTEGHIFHNRMTHTLEVAQIGRRLAEKLRDRYEVSTVNQLGGIDPDVVEAAALVHDLGHPPFGHIAESELQSLLEPHSELPGSFEGNAQSFRIVTKLAIHHFDLDREEENYPGLNLTRATLNAALKYPWTRAADGKKARKWGVYESDEEDFAWARKGPFSLGDNRSVEAELMDWADDVAYSVHDVEDFFRAGIIPLDRLVGTRSRERSTFLDRAMERRAREGRNMEFEAADLREAAETAIRLMPVAEPYTGSRQQRGQLRQLTSSLIDRYINAIDLDPNVPADKRVRKDPPLEMEVAMLKELTWDYVVNNPALATRQEGQRRIIQTLFGVFGEASVDPKRLSLFPASYREKLKQIEESDDGSLERMRTVVDFIASLTEQQAVNLYQRVTGYSSGPTLERFNL